MRMRTRSSKGPRPKRDWHRRPATGAAIVALAVIELVLFGIELTVLKTSLLTIAVYEGIEGEPLKRAAETFSSGDTHARIQVREFSYDELYTEELRSAEAPIQGEDSRFDVIMLDDPWLEGLLSDKPGPGGKLRLAQLPPPEDAADFYTSCLRVGQHPYCDTAQAACPSPYYAMPLVGNSQLFCYREAKDWKPPTTWAEIAGTSGKAGSPPPNAGRSQAASEPSYIMRLGAGNSIVTDFIPMLWGSESRPAGHPPISLASSPRAKLGAQTETAFVQFAKLAVGGNFGTQSLDDFDLAVYMADGKARTSIIWSGYAMALANSGSATDALQDLRFGAVPGIPLLGAWLLAAPANRSPSQQKLAADFIKFATSRKQMEDAAKLGSPPPRKSVLTSAEFRRQYRLSSAAQEQSLETAWPRPRWQDWKEVERQMGDCLSDLSAGVIGAGDAWDAINGVILPSPGKASGTRRTGCASHVVEAGDFRQR